MSQMFLVPLAIGITSTLVIAVILWKTREKEEMMKNELEKYKEESKA